MKSLHYVLIQVDQSYNNELMVGDISVITNNTIESVANINRIAKVISAPEGVVLKAGDEIIFHHNILRTIYGYKGQKIFSEYWVKDNIYFIPPAEIFAYRNNAGWTALSPYCFVEPITASQTGELIQNKDEYTHKGNERLQGLIWLNNPELESQGIRVGDRVLYTPYSEHAFEIDGKEYYKMRTKDIVAKI